MVELLRWSSCVAACPSTHHANRCWLQVVKLVAEQATYERRLACVQRGRPKPLLTAAAAVWCPACMRGGTPPVPEEPTNTTLTRCVSGPDGSSLSPACMADVASLLPPLGFRCRCG